MQIFEKCNQLTGFEGKEELQYQYRNMGGVL